MAFDLRLVNKMFVLAKDKDKKWKVHKLLGHGIWTMDSSNERVGNLNNRNKYKYFSESKIKMKSVALNVGEQVYSTSEKGHREIFYVLSVIKQDDGKFETVIAR